VRYVLHSSPASDHECVSRELKRESYGFKLLQTIGFVYASKAKHHLATNQTFLGVGGWFHNVQGKYHVFSEMSITSVYPMFHYEFDIVLVVY